MSQQQDHTLTKPLTKPSIMDIFVHRPILSIVISVVLVLMGWRAALELPVLQFPQIESAALEITTTYVGASAEVVQGFITDPIERAAASVPGVDYIDSTTVAGFSTVKVWLKLNQSSSTALAELSTRLDRIRFELPAGAEDPSVMVRRADRPNAGFYLTVLTNNEGTGGMSRSEATDYLTRRINPVIASINGVQRVGIEGGRLPAMRIWLNPQRLALYDLGSEDVEAALKANNIISTIGRSKNSDLRINLLTDSSLQTIADFETLVVKQVDGAQVRIGDIARVTLGEEEGEVNARQDQNNAVYISVWPLPGANEIDIADQLYQTLDQLNPTLPDGLKIDIAYDVTRYMRDALKEIFITLIETIVLVGLVVLAFMGSLRTALIPLITIPISLLGAVAAMAALGFSLNLLTILAIVLSVGLVVDDAIVVVENVARHMREGMSRTQAALTSSRQLLTPIIGMTITLAAVYAPVGFLSGLTGVLFKEFAFTLAVAVLISGVVAVTLSPIMSAYASPLGGREGWLTKKVNAQFAKIQQYYSKLLDHTLTWQAQVLVMGLFIALLTIPFYFLSLQELAPIEDQGSINVIVESAPDASLEYTTSAMFDVVDTMSSTEGADMMWQILTPVGGFSGMEYVAFDQRERSVHELLPEVYGKLAQVSGVRALPVLPAALPTAGNFDVELVVLSSDSPQQMQQYANQLVGAAYQSGRFMFADTDLKTDLPQARFHLNRARIADLGMDLAQVSQQLGLLLSGNYVNRFDFDGKAYRVIPMIEGTGRLTPQALMDLKIRTPRGDLISISTIAILKMEVAPRLLGKFQQKNAFRVYGGLIPGSTKEQALAALEAAAKEFLPGHYTLDYAGESRQLRQQGNTLMGVLATALIFVFLVLAVQFNSWRDPLVVLLGSVPLALSGAMLFTFLGTTTINIYSQIGFITLVGLIAKNAILIVEFANQLQTEGLSKLAAVKGAATTRLRPVLMTTGATVLGHFPLVLVVGAGAEARNSIGIILVAGMLLGTLFTLFVLPCVYMLLASVHSSEHSPKESQDTAVNELQPLPQA
ncbi:MAG: multidrug efflux pump [Phenylobacterium sp.]|jgi:multidrug efflux pump